MCDVPCPFYCLCGVLTQIVPPIKKVCAVYPLPFINLAQLVSPSVALPAELVIFYCQATKFWTSRKKQTFLIHHNPVSVQGHTYISKFPVSKHQKNMHNLECKLGLGSIFKMKLSSFFRSSSFFMFSSFLISSSFLRLL